MLVGTISRSLCADTESLGLCEIYQQCMQLTFAFSVVEQHDYSQATDLLMDICNSLPLHDALFCKYMCSIPQSNHKAKRKRKFDRLDLRTQ
jgi:hypothetical protein